MDIRLFLVGSGVLTFLWLSGIGFFFYHLF